MFDYADLVALASNEVDRAVLLSGSSIALLLTALGESLEKMWLWAGSGDFNTLTDAEKDNAKALIALAERELMSGLTGVFFAEIVDHPGSLACDGSQYLRANYPALYEHWVGTDLIVDADNFVVPDMRSCFVLGADSLRPPLSYGGTEDVTLTLDQIPSHSHSEISAVPAIINGGLEAPAAAATPSFDSTGLSGGGQSHTNMPPFIALRWYVWT